MDTGYDERTNQQYFTLMAASFKMATFGKFLFRICTAVLSLWASTGVCIAAESRIAEVANLAEDIVLQLHDEEELVGTGFTVYYKGELASRSYGSISEDGSEPLTPITPNALHELAQPFTALAVMQLVARELVDPDLPFSNWFPQFIPWKQNPAWQDFTIRQLMAHHSGLPAYFAPGSGMEVHEPDLQAQPWNNLVSRSDEIALVAEPGTVYEYSYLGYSLLGSLIEKVSGLTYQEYIKTNILDPLGMAQTTFVADPSAVSGISPAFINDETVAHRIFRDLPGAGLVSTLDDMGQFMKGLLEAGRILDSGSLQQIFSVQNQGLPQDANFEIGLGFFVSPVTGGAFYNTRTASHASTDGVARSYLLLYPEKELGVLLTTNTRLSSVKLRDTTDRIMEQMLEQEPEGLPEPWQAHKESSLAEAESDRLKGTYSGPGGLFTVEESRKGLKLEVPYLPFLNVSLIPREEGYYGVDIRLLGFLNLGRMSQVRQLSGSLEGKILDNDGRKLFFWYWRGVAAVTLTELPVPQDFTAINAWKARVGRYSSNLTSGEYTLEFIPENNIFTFGFDGGGFRLFRDPPEIYCAVTVSSLQTCGKGLVGTGSRNVVRAMAGGGIRDAMGVTYNK